MRRVSNRACSASQPDASSGYTVVPVATRSRMVGTASSSARNTKGSVRPPRSRLTTTRRLPDWFSARLRSSVRTEPPK